MDRLALHRFAPCEAKLQMNVLVVDDALFIRRATADFIDSLGHSTMTASNGKEAVELAGKYEFDMILMDIHMPVMDGYEATRAIRAQGMDMPIVAYSAGGDRRRCLEAGMDEFVEKNGFSSLRALLGIMPQRR